MPSQNDRRTHFFSNNKSRSEGKAIGVKHNVLNTDKHGAGDLNKFGIQSFNLGKIVNVADILLGITVMLAVGGTHSWLVYQLHENNLWFTNIKEVEREISFRTEAGLYYSYYKQLILSNHYMKGVQDLCVDNLTEHPSTINVLERMNIYQEVALAGFYKLYKPNMKPILFYIYSVFGLQSLLVSGLYLIAWFLTGSWLAGLLSALLYIFNRLDTTRVAGTGPLRENFSLPFIWLQAAALTVYLRPGITVCVRRLSLSAVFVCTFLFCLFWQFSQFIMMLQAFSLFGIWVLGILKAQKTRKIMMIQLTSLLLVCLLQFGNKMIIGSLAVSFLLVVIPLISLLGDQTRPGSLPRQTLRVAGISVLALVLMFGLNIIVKLLANVDSDEHVFKFLQNKFGMGDSRDFDANMYLCLGIFGFITRDVFERLTTNWALPLYVPAHLGLLIWLVYSVIGKWRSVPAKHAPQGQQSSEAMEITSRETETQGVDAHPELAYHSVQAVFFGALSMLTLRMKYFWTPYMCVIAAMGVADKRLWAKVLALLNIRRPYVVDLLRSSSVVLLISLMVAQLLPPVLKELKNETEFWDPDTVELMEWIKANTAPAASFTGSMQLLAGVKLCTGRPITNHPHYEDKNLRIKTRQLYEIYGRKSAEAVHTILKQHKSNYIILEDSICRAPSRGGCRLPDLLDISNGEMPDEPVNLSGLAKPSGRRFCEAVRYQKANYARYFKPVLVNNTFRVYKVL